MSKNNNQMLGLVLGGALAGLAGFLVASKSGQELCSNIAHKYDEISDKAEEFTGEIKHRSWHLLNPDGECSICDKSSPAHFIIGSLAGAVLGVAAAAVLAPKSGPQLRRDIGKTYKEVANNVERGKEKVEEFIETLQSAASGVKNSSTLESVFELANLGLKAWHKYQKRK